MQNSKNFTLQIMPCKVSGKFRLLVNLQKNLKWILFPLFVLLFNFCSGSKKIENKVQSIDASPGSRLEEIINHGGLKAACSYSGFTGFPQYKANLHCHSHHSDGSQYCDEVAAWYLKHGYKVLSISDHDHAGDQDGGIKNNGMQNDKIVHDWNGDGVIYDTLIIKSGVEAYVRDYSMPAPAWVSRNWQLERPGEFIILNGIECSTGHPHINAINHPAGRIVLPIEGYGFIDRCHSNDGLVIINHPYAWNNHPEKIYNDPNLSRIDGLEVMNGFLSRDTRKENNEDGSRGNAEPLWDGCLDAGLRLWGFGNDDAHTMDTSHFAGAGSAWNMIWAKELTRPAIMEAIRSGAFYATCGVIVDNVELTENSIKVSSQNATHIKVVGEGGKTLMQVAGSSAIYTLKGDEKWLRVVLWNDTICYPEPGKPKFTQKAWLQPIMIGQLL